MNLQEQERNWLKFRGVLTSPEFLRTKQSKRFVTDIIKNMLLTNQTNCYLVKTMLAANVMEHFVQRNTGLGFRFNYEKINDTGPKLYEKSIRQCYGHYKDIDWLY